MYPTNTKKKPTKINQQKTIYKPQEQFTNSKVVTDKWIGTGVTKLCPGACFSP